MPHGKQPAQGVVDSEICINAIITISMACWWDQGRGKKIEIFDTILNTLEKVKVHKVSMIDQNES